MSDDAKPCPFMGPPGGLPEDILLALPTTRRDRMALLPKADLRMLRARLALLLRAMLRDVPTEQGCEWCDWRASVLDSGDPGCNGPPRLIPLRYHALWEQATEHRG